MSKVPLREAYIKHVNELRPKFEAIEDVQDKLQGAIFNEELSMYIHDGGESDFINGMWLMFLCVGHRL